MKAGYQVTIDVTKSPDEVFRCITQDVSKWWGGDDLEGSSTKLNDEFTIHHPGSHFSRQKVVEFVPSKKLAWHITEGTLHWLTKDQHEWTNTKLIFDIVNNENSTRLNFTHIGLVPELECYERVSEGWRIVITDWLFNFISNGTPRFDNCENT
jgi:hypothetical protein